MDAFVLNNQGRLVFPENFWPDLDFTVFETLPQFETVIRRDFEAKAPTGADILSRVESNGYGDRHELLRDLTLNLMWVNRYAMTMYEKRPMRWRDVPRHRDDVFLPVLTPWEEGERKINAVQNAYRELPAAWDAEAEDRIFELVFHVFRNRKHHATELPAIKPTVAEILAEPGNRTFHLPSHDPDHRLFSYQEIVDCYEQVPELEALHRRAMVLNNQYPWDVSQTWLTEVRAIGPDDFVVLFVPRNEEVMAFIRRVKENRPSRRRPPAAAPSQEPVQPYPPVEVPKTFRVMPRIESLTAIKGEHACSNEDLIRNAGYNWSPMSAAEIAEKTGIETRAYTEMDLDMMVLIAAQAAMEKAGRSAQDIGAVLFCSCTTTRLIPSLATWLSGQLGIYQTHASFDLIAACAGLPYGLGEAVRLLQEVNRPVLLVCGEKFSDKIGSVRTSRMIFGDGACAMVIGPAPAGVPSDIEVVQTYASGPVSQVNSIIWPNPEFDNNITVYGPEVRALVQRYLAQMLAELKALPHPEGGAGSLLDAVELVVPHQANKTMVSKAAEASGLSPELLYFNIDRVGNVSAASIPLAIVDAVQDGVIDRPMRVFAPGFGAGAVAGYAVMRVDPAVVVNISPVAVPAEPGRLPFEPPTSEDVRVAFGE
jgi:3-oxoacyl-[acyl-carrier-protein] synthase III